MKFRGRILTIVIVCVLALATLQVLSFGASSLAQMPPKDGPQKRPPEPPTPPPPPEPPSQCPGDTGTPLTPLETLIGPWAFTTTGVRSALGKSDSGTDVEQPVTSAGNFTASIDSDSSGKFQMGVLTFTITSSIQGQIIRQERGSGSYTVNSDCTGGTLTFDMESGQESYDFYYGGDSASIFVIGVGNGDTLGGFGLGRGLGAKSCTGDTGGRCWCEPGQFCCQIPRNGCSCLSPGTPCG
jgi:hypothetical protein